MYKKCLLFLAPEGRGYVYVAGGAGAFKLAAVSIRGPIKRGAKKAAADGRTVAEKGVGTVAMTGRPS